MVRWLSRREEARDALLAMDGQPCSPKAKRRKTRSMAQLMRMPCEGTGAKRMEKDVVDAEKETTNHVVERVEATCSRNGLLLDGTCGIDLNAPVHVQEKTHVAPAVEETTDPNEAERCREDAADLQTQAKTTVQPAAVPIADNPGCTHKTNADVPGCTAAPSSYGPTHAKPIARKANGVCNKGECDFAPKAAIDPVRRPAPGHRDGSMPEEAPSTTPPKEGLHDRGLGQAGTRSRSQQIHRETPGTSAAAPAGTRKNRRCVSRPTRKTAEASSGVFPAAELVESFRTFEKERKSRIVLSQWPLKELNPWTTVGRWIASTWDEGLFYVGRIVYYDSWTRCNLIQYLDGDEEFSIPSKRVRYIVLTYPGEILPLHPKHEAEGKCAVFKRNGCAPGEVVWMHAPGGHPWPALVVSPLDLLHATCAGEDTLKGLLSTVCVQCFGSYEYHALPPAQCSSFLDSIQVASARSPTNSTSFSLAIQETLTYLEKGELPSTMIPKNMDRPEEWLPVVTADPKILSDFQPLRMSKDEVKSRLAKMREERVQERLEKIANMQGTQTLPLEQKGNTSTQQLPKSKKKKELEGILQRRSPSEYKDVTRKKEKPEANASAVAKSPSAKSFTPVEYEQLPWNCYVCNEWEEYEENMLLDCSKCGTLVHMHCYGVSENPNGGLWLCDVCKEGLEETPTCALCPVQNGRAMKRTSCGRWVHSACAMWIPEVYYEDPEKMDIVSGLEMVPKVRFQLQCGVCRVSHGACLQCDQPQCYNSYHVLCARHRGYRMDILETFDEHTEELTRISMCRRHSPLAPPEAALAAEGQCDATSSGSFELENKGWQEGCSRAHAFSGRTVGRRAQVGARKRTFLYSLPYVIHGRMKHGQSILSHSVRRQGKASFKSHPAPKDLEVLTNKEKMELMRDTQGQRITIGKSAIHGWGAFCKVSHRKGDLVVEYVGGIARSVICDLRESRDYKSLVGAGTYLFKVTHEFAVDATRCGNIAHLINHSCEPNCYSRVLKVDSAEHIVIVALRDLEAGEELTYDYRFSSDEDLQCNCGSASCRGTVNFDGMSKDYFTAPTVELLHLTQTRQVSDS